MPQFSSKEFNPLAYRLPFAKPPFLDIHSAWVEHIPFGQMLIELHRPRNVVELGTHYGTSYFSLCAAIKALNLECTANAVDTWQGDEHAGFYGDEVYEIVQQRNSTYVHFSTLHRKPFKEALSYFPNGSVDLLHIDGYHTYECVSEDYHTWLPKLSTRGIILFHDTNVFDHGFGVHILWKELALQYPHFNFLHGYGLGVLAVGQEINAETLSFFNLSSNEDSYSRTCTLFEALGKNLLHEHLKERISALNPRNTSTMPFPVRMAYRIAAKLDRMTASADQSERKGD